MNLHIIDFATWPGSAHEFSRLAAKAERRLLKRWLKHPLAQIGLKIEAQLVTFVSSFMRGIKTLEQGRALRWGEACLLSLASLVRQDGLKFTILITTLGYAAWCINHL